MKQNPWFVYMLLCDRKIFYIGITNNLGKRLIEHKSKKSLYTRRFSDIKLVYCEEYQSKYEAAERERQLKGWSRAKKQKLIEGKLGWNQCTELAKVFTKDENL